MRTLNASRFRAGVRSLQATLIAIAVALWLASTALAASPPEAPQTKAPSAITTTGATWAGTLNPGTSPQAGTYEFLYKRAANGAGCEGESASTPGTMTGTAKQSVSEPSPKLEPNLQYTVCLTATNGSGERTAGNEQTFKTLAAPPSISSVYTSSLTATEARVEAIVNASNQSTECHVQYGASSLTEHELPCEQPSIEGGEQGVALTLTGLTQHTTYHYEFVLTNATGTAHQEAEVMTSAPEPPETKPASAITGSSAVLHGVLNPKHEGEPGTYQFVYRQSASECEHEGAPENATPSQTAAAAREEVSGSLTGLLPGTPYTFCLLAHTPSGEALGPTQTFTTDAVASTIEGESFTSISSTSATLTATIDPGGAPTSYHFEYGPTTAYGSTTPVASAGGGAHPGGVLANLEALTPNTVYHVRVIATNSIGSAQGRDQTFSTFPQGIVGLPDGRGYELVSPLNNGDATVLRQFVGRQGAVRATSDGSAVTYTGLASPTGGNDETPGGLSSEPYGANVYLARRSSTGGWSAADIQPAATGTNYLGFSSDLSLGVLSSEGPLTSGGSPNGEGEKGLYSREEVGSYRLLSADAEYDGATSDDSHMLYQTPSGAEGGLYDEAGGRSVQVSVLPTGVFITNATFGAPEPTGRPNEEAEHNLDNAISEDGARIVWTDTDAEETPENPAGGTRLFLRENDTSPTAVTAQVDAPEPGCGACESGNGVYEAASSDGTRVFFTDERRLTSDSNATSGQPDLYEYRPGSDPGAPGTVTDLTPKAEHSGEHANVVGVLGASKDGSYLYFAAGGALTTGAEHQECREQTFTEIYRDEVTKCNVYVVHEGDGLQHVTTLAAADGTGIEHVTSYATALSYSVGPPASRFGDWAPDAGFRTADVTPDGQHLVFASFEDLTGSVHDDEAGREIYMYDYKTERTDCVSCNPTGTPSVHSEAGLPFTIAYAELAPSLNPTFELRVLSANGNRVFFLSNEALVAQVANAKTPYDSSLHTGLTNVYEWERPQSSSEAGDSCATSSQSYSTVDQGCIFLLSGGTSTDASFFLDASESGDDVFFATRSDLVPRDRGETYEVYDARVGATEPPTEAACSGTGCQGVPPAPPIFSSPASATTAGGEDFGLQAAPKATTPSCGSSNGAPSSKCSRKQNLGKALTLCHKDEKKAKRKACEKAAKKRYGAAPPKRTKKK
jgi:hypothetical protein